MKRWRWARLGMCVWGEEGMCGFELGQASAGGMGLPGQSRGSAVRGWGLGGGF